MGNEHSAPSASTQHRGSTTTLHKYYAETSEELGRKRAEVADLKSENAQLKEDLQRMNYSTEMSNQWRSSYKNDQDEILRLNNIIVTLQTKVDKSAATSNQWRSSYKNDQDEILRLNNIIVTLQTKVDKSAATISQCNAEKAGLYARIHKLTDDNEIKKRDEMVLKLQTQVGGMQETMKKLKELNRKLLDPAQICTVENVVDNNGAVDYKQLSRKVLFVKKLEYSGERKDKWLADDVEITFESGDFYVWVSNELSVKHASLSTMLNRVLFINLRKLYLADVEVSYDLFKRMVVSRKIQVLSLQRITVEETHGPKPETKVRIDELLEHVPDVETFEYIFNDDEITPETASKLAELPVFPKLQEFYLNEIQDNFDLKMFIGFIKKHPGVEYHLLFRSEKCYHKLYVLKKEIPCLSKLHAVLLK